MTTLVHTSPEGPAGQQLSLLTSTTRARSLVQTLDSSLVDNASLVAGATVSDALNNLVATIGALNSNQVLNASAVAGVSVTDALNALNAALAPPAVQSVIGWAPASLGTQNLQLLAAGHPAGLYELSFSIVVRTTATGSALGVSVTWSVPTFGADNKGFGGAMSWSAAGTITIGVGNQAGTTRQLAVMSDGTQPITLVFSAGLITAGAPVADLYGLARRIAQ